jgi:hypothetical protein
MRRQQGQELQASGSDPLEQVALGAQPMKRVDIKVWRYSTDLDPQLRETLIVEFDVIADQIFSKQGNVFKNRESFYFNETTGLAVATIDERLIAYSIYKRLNVLGEVVLYSVATNVTPEYQSGGLRRRFLKSMVQAERQSDNVAPTYLAFRTRNPIAWHVFWRCCSSIMPNYVDPAIDTKLVDLGIATAKEIFPELEVERPTMIMRNAFDWVRYLSQPTHRDDSINAAFFRSLSQTDAIFVVGRMRPDLLLS